MLWRESFRPDIRYHPVLPITPAPLIIGGFSLACLGEVEMWRRLADDAQVTYLELYGLENPAELQSLLPPSRYRKAQLVNNRKERLEALRPYPDGRSFAATRQMVIVGPSTEDAWEEMVNRLNGSLPTL